jgi:hypothetical protein
LKLPGPATFLHALINFHGQRPDGGIRFFGGAHIDFRYSTENQSNHGQQGHAQTIAQSVTVSDIDDLIYFNKMLLCTLQL